jgi:hypothetical protein
LQSDTPDVQAGALTALGHVQNPPPGIIDHLLTDHASRLTAFAPLARLAARSQAAARERVLACLRDALPDAAAAAALVRLVVTTAGQEIETGSGLATLAQDLPDRSALLAALLGAGTDDDLWGDYHERVVALIRELVQAGGEALLRQLLHALRRVLDGADWPPKRIALAGVAATAAAMPDVLNAALPRDQLEPLLLEGSHEAESHSARRYAITALSHLRVATPAVLAALLDAAADVAQVQGDAVQAAGRFRHLSPDFKETESLAPLAQALTGPSGARAYLAARVLAALGRSPAALSLPGLRERIAAILADALRHPDAGREVYLLSGVDYIKSQGSLSQALFAALVEVWGLPE